MSSNDRIVVSVVLGRWQANCYVVVDRSNRTAAIIDPGEDGAPVVARILAMFDVRAQVILLTHGHLDHLWSVPELATSLDVPVLLHPDDRWLFDDPAAAFGLPAEVLAAELALDWDPPVDRLSSVSDGQRLEFAGTSFGVRHTPGHTPGHVTYLADGMRGVDFALAPGDAEMSRSEADPIADSTADEHVLFSGDLVFAGSIGRTDFPRGDDEQMRRSLTETVLDLDDETLILSGHGPWTTVGRERTANPFLRELAARRG